MRPIKIGNIEIPVVEVEGLEGAALVSPDAVAQVFTIDSNGKIVHIKTEIDPSKIAVLDNTPSENKRAKRRRKLGYDEPSMDERTDNINNAVEALSDTPSEKGE